MTYRGPLKAVILDWAGTTVDYGCFAPAVAFVEAFRREGVDVTVAQAREPMGMHKRDHIVAISAMKSVADQWRAANGRDFGEDDIDRIYADFIPLQVGIIADYADVIPGTLEAVEEFRARGLKIGTTTGYNGEMVAALVPEARKRGYEPDSIVTASDVPSGRPAPWMALRNMELLGVYPPAACVKIGDTVPDVDEGLNAGMWSIGVTLTGNEVGLREDEVQGLSPDDLLAVNGRAADKLRESGAHYVVDSIADAVPLLDDIERRLSAGDCP